MFLGIRDIVHARGRFALIGAVVALITLLLVMLTGLTSGLGAQSTSALSTLGPDRFAFAPVTEGEDAQISFTDSAVTVDNVEAWENTAGIASVSPVGLTMTRLEASSAASVAVIGLPAGDSLPGGGQIPAGGVVVSSSLIDAAGTRPGDSITLGGVEVELLSNAPDEFYSHVPVVWADTATWQAVSHVDEEAVGTVLAIDGELTDSEWTEASSQTGTVVATVQESFSGLASYQSEQGSLRAMQGFLYGISALVTVSFLAVWTIQRTRDLAILRALGASTRYLMTDSLGQGALILGLGVTAGSVVGWGLGVFAAQAVPIALSPVTVIAPAVGIWLLGVVGAFIATWQVASVDPLSALGGNA
ncbi:ABC transporter permease [Corynebacterium alimapuense]|uniref:ABC transporter permease n=1 Tax=Corynebacterium alimapuense TaxID=1576874 RepID=A0A3M8K4E1_9CORY|nr:ABC transporter permease [Corynebacterium alimapuense]RNE48093.1 ABC transporter permease [Corynebacterium alimapuense]